MTLANLWLPVLGGPQSPFAPATSGSGTATAAGSTFTITLPNSYTTALNDCIVLAVCAAGGSGVWGGGVSGGGATWDASVFVRHAVSGGPALGLYIGYACSGGATTVTVSGLTAAWDIPWAVSVWKGVRFASDPLITSSTAQTVGTGSVSYSADNLLVGAIGNTGGTGTGWAPPASWGDGGADNTLGDPTMAAAATFLSYRTVPFSSGSTTYGSPTYNPVPFFALSAVAVLSAAP